MSRERFLAVFPVIRADLLQYMDEEKMPSEAKAWFAKVRAVWRVPRLTRAVPRPQHARWSVRPVRAELTAQAN